MIRRAAAGLVFLLAGCAGLPPLPPIAVSPNGPVQEHPGVECPVPDDHAGCTVRARDGRWDTYYPAGYAVQRGHEWDHTQGMVHGPWVSANGETCATILAAGLTHWHVGARLCTRRSWTDPLLVDAPYYERP